MLITTPKCSIFHLLFIYRLLLSFHLAAVVVVGRYNIILYTNQVINHLRNENGQILKGVIQAAGWLRKIERQQYQTRVWLK